jgi:hypothetical protein
VERSLGQDELAIIEPGSRIFSTHGGTLDFSIDTDRCPTIVGIICGRGFGVDLEPASLDVASG